MGVGCSFWALLFISKPFGCSCAGDASLSDVNHGFLLLVVDLLRQFFPSHSISPFSPTDDYQPGHLSPAVRGLPALPRHAHQQGLRGDSDPQNHLWYMFHTQISTFFSSRSLITIITSPNESVKLLAPWLCLKLLLPSLFLFISHAHAHTHTHADGHRGTLGSHAVVCGGCASV